MRMYYKHTLYCQEEKKNKHTKIMSSKHYQNHKDMTQALIRDNIFLNTKFYSMLS